MLPPFFFAFWTTVVICSDLTALGVFWNSSQEKWEVNREINGFMIHGGMFPTEKAAVAKSKALFRQYKDLHVPLPSNANRASSNPPKADLPTQSWQPHRSISNPPASLPLDEGPPLLEPVTDHPWEKMPSEFPQEKEKLCTAGSGLSVRPLWLAAMPPLDVTLHVVFWFYLSSVSMDISWTRLLCFHPLTRRA